MKDASVVAQTLKNLPAVQETQVQSWGWEDPLEKGMATSSSILAWRMPWTEEHDQMTVHGITKELDMTERLSHFHNKKNPRQANKKFSLIENLEERKRRYTEW